jgi:Rhodopirellula transposase DDE domain
MRLLIIRTEGWRPAAAAHQRQLVLASATLLPGASKAPMVTAEASSHGDNPDAAGPQRRAAAPAAATTAATASARSDPAGAGSSGSGSSPHANAVNAERSGPARPAARRSQPRTVAAGRPSCSATIRCPCPAAASASACPITPAASARRSRHLTGSSTCVRPHPAHLDRRGRSRHLIPSPARITRGRPCPHRPSLPPHPGQASRPSESCRSTIAVSLPTVSTGASARLSGPPGALPQDSREGPPHLDMLTLSPDMKKGNRTRLPSSVLNHADAGPPADAHTERRLTAGVSETTVQAGVFELEEGQEPFPEGRVRRGGGGRKSAAALDAGLVPALLTLVEPDERGDPESPLRWTTKSLRHLAGELARQGHLVSAPTVGKFAARQWLQPAGQRQDAGGGPAPGP